jgi:hypothetical protein
VSGCGNSSNIRTFKKKPVFFIKRVKVINKILSTPTPPNKQHPHSNIQNFPPTSQNQSNSPKPNKISPKSASKKKTGLIKHKKAKEILKLK